MSLWFLFRQKKTAASVEAAVRSDQMRDRLALEQAFDGIALFLKLIDGGINFALAEWADREALNDFPFAVFEGANGHGCHEAFFDAVRTIGADSNGVPVTSRSWGDEALDGVEGSVGSGSRGRCAASFDDGSSTLLDGGDEITLEPLHVSDHVGYSAAIDFGVGEIRILSGGVVAPDAHVSDFRNMHAGFGSELAFCTVLVEASHGKEAVVWHAICVVHRDEGIGIARVADDENADVVRCVTSDGFSLASEDFAVDAEQIATFHPRFARYGAHKETPVGAFEAFVEVRRASDVVEKRECAIIEFHHDAFESSHARLNLDQTQVDRLVRAEDKAGSDAEEEGIADLASCASDRNGNRCFHVLIREAATVGDLIRMVN